MGLLKDVIYLSKEDYETLVRTGTVTIDGETLTYDENNLYLTPETQNVKSVNSVTPDANGNVSIPVGTGTVTEVTAGTGLVIAEDETINPKVCIDSDYKLPTLTEWNGLVTSVDSINPVSGNISLSAVRYVSQTLTDTQKTQARTNISAAASSHAHGNITSDGKITSTAVSSASGVLVYDSNNIIQRASGANARSIIGAAAGSVNTTNKTVTIDGNTLTFHNNAFTDTTIPVTYIQSASKSNDGNTLTLTPITNGTSGTAITFTPTFTEQHIGDVISIDKTSDSHLDVNPTSGNVVIGVSSGYSIPSNTKQDEWDAKGTYSKPAGGIPGSDLAENYVPFDANNNVQLTKSIYLNTVGGSINDASNSRLAFGTPSTIYSYLVSNQSGAFALAKDSSHGFIFYPGGTYSCFMPNFPADLGRNDTNGSYAWRNLYLTGSIYHHTGNNSFVQLSLPTTAGTLALKSEIPVDHNQTVKGDGTAFGANDVIDIVGGGATTVTADTTNKKITISTPSVTDHNQTIKGNGTAFSADDAVNIVGSGIVSVSANTTNKTITITGTEAHVGDVLSVGAEDGLENSGTATAPVIGVDSDHKLPTNTEWGERLHYCDTLSSVGGNGSSGSYLSVRWYTSGIDGITTPYNGMRIWVKVPLAGVSTAGVVLSINGNNNADYYPVVYNVNTVLTSHFPANSYKCLVFTTGNPNNVNGYLTSNTATKYTSYWHADANYDTNTTMTYGTLAYYFRPYVKEAVYRYKLVMLDHDNRLTPLSITNLAETAYSDYASSTSYAKDVVVHRNGKWYKSLAASNKGHTPESSASWWSEIAPSTPTSTPFRPDKIYWYNTTTTISAGGLMGGNVLMDIGYNQPYMAYCNFNEGMLAYRMIYLCGTYNSTTGLFTLRDGGTAGSKLYYTTAPTNSGSITLSSYFTSGYDYILVGGTYSSNNYLHLRDDHPMYHFDGTNLVPYDTWYTRSYIQSLVYTGDYN